jgi:hypothetical protein
MYVFRKLPNQCRFGPWLLGFFSVCTLTTLAQPRPRPVQSASPPDRNLTGVWVLVTQPATPLTPASRLKFIGAGRWSLTQAQDSSGLISIHHGGRYNLQQQEYSETVDYANPNTASYIGTTLHFRIQIQRDTMRLSGIDNTFDETWARVHQSVSRVVPVNTRK